MNVFPELEICLDWDTITVALQQSCPSDECNDANAYQ